MCDLRTGRKHVLRVISERPYVVEQGEPADPYGDRERAATCARYLAKVCASQAWPLQHATGADAYETLCRLRALFPPAGDLSLPPGWRLGVYRADDDLYVLGIYGPGDARLALLFSPGVRG